MTKTRRHTVPDNTFWQANRMLPALDPSGAEMDARSIADMIRWAEGMADGLTFFDAQGRIQPPPQGWASFWRNDVVFLLAEMCAQTPGLDYRRFSEDTCEVPVQTAKQVENILNWRTSAANLAMLTPHGSIEHALLGVLDNAARNELFGALPRGLAPNDIQMRDIETQEMFETGDGGANTPDHDDRRREHDVVYSLVTRVIGQIVERARELLHRALSDKSDHPPQIGLFLAFLDMFRHAQDAMNGLAERHLDFYYKTVLGLAPNHAIVDHADIAFVLDPKATGAVVPQGTHLVGDGGSDPIIFATDRVLNVVPMHLRALRSIAITRHPQRGGGGTITQVRAFPVANSHDGFGPPYTRDDAAWPCFGPADPRIPGVAIIGFALAAPILAAPSGNRQITVTLEFTNSHTWRLETALKAFRARIANSAGTEVSDAHLAAKLARAFAIEITAGPEVMIPIDHVTLRVNLPRNHLELILLVPQGAPAIAPNPLHSVHPGDPVLNIALSPDASFHALSVFSEARVARVDIALDVTECRSVQVSTTAGAVDPGKPFAPFGPFATSGSALFIDSAVLRQPGLTKVGLHLGWSGLPIPPQSFTTHYAEYDLDIDAPSYRVSLDFNTQNDWHPIGDTTLDQPLFLPTSKGKTRLKDTSTFAGHVAHTLTHQIQQPGTPALRLKLLSPDAGFGQSAYPNILTAYALAQAAKPKGLRAVFSKTNNASAPKPPLDVKVSDLSISYSAQASGRPGDPNSAVQFLSMTPAGQMVPDPDGRIVDDFYDYDGAMLIGFDGVDTPLPISLYFDIEETTAPPWSPRDRFAYPTLEWRYFNGSVWKTLGDAAILDDGTKGLSRPGIVRLALPPDMSPGARYPGGLHWLAVAVHGDLAHYGLLRGIYPNAVPTTRRPDDRIPLLPARQLSRLEVPINGIKSVLQPRNSHNGRAAEDTDAFRLRVSERLGHKGRAILPRDYGRLILQHFPDVAQVSVVTHTSGRLDVIVSPLRGASEDRPNDVAYWRRADIAYWLHKRTGIERKRILVRNPDYEPIRISARVAVEKDTPPGILGRVAQAIDRVIAPWRADPDVPLPIGASHLDTAAIYAALEHVPGVIGVAGLGAVQVFRTRDRTYHLKDTARGSAGDQRRILVGSGHASVLIPARQHDLDFLTNRHGIGDLTVGQDFFLATPDTKRAYQTGALSIPVTPKRFGIGQMTIGHDLVITDPQDTVVAAAARRKVTPETAAFAPLFE